MLKVCMVAILFLLGACASVPMGDPQRDATLKTFPVPADKVGVFIYRPYALVDSGLANEVLVDDQRIGATVVNTYLYVEVPPGRHIVKLQFSGDQATTSVPVDTMIGKLVFVSAKLDSENRLGLNVEAEDDAEKEVLQCALAQTRIRRAAPTKQSWTGSMPDGSSSMAAGESASPLSTEENEHFKATLANGKPAQLYFLATKMTNEGHEDLANKLYQKLVDKYPDDIYTAKAIEKMDHATRRSAGGGSSQQTAYNKEAHDSCVALCQSQAQQCNTDALSSAGPGAASALSIAGSGSTNAMGMLSGLGSVLMASNKDCDTPMRACVAACPPSP